MSNPFQAMIDSAEIAIDPICNFEKNGSLVCYQDHEFSVSFKGEARFKSKGDLFWDLVRAPRLFFKSKTIEWEPGIEKKFSSEEILEFKNVSFQVDAELSNFGNGDSYEFVLSNFKRTDWFNPDAIHFLMPNSRLDGILNIKTKTTVWSGRVKDTIGKYEIEIDKFTSKELKKKENHFSHIVRIKKAKGSFESKEVSKLARYLQTTFSFLDGYWLAPIYCFATRDGVPEIIWINDDLRTEKIKKVRNWYFDGLRTFDPKIFSKVYDFVSQEYNEQLMQHCLTWYFESLDGDPMKGVIANNLILEMLSWAVIVELRESVSESGFDGLPAADKVNILLELIDIEKVNKDDFPNLAKYCTGAKLKFGPEAITKIRNSIIHCRKKSRDDLSNIEFPVYFEAQQLGMWYVENCLLSLLKYKGRIFQPYGDYSPLSCVPVDYTNHVQRSEEPT